MAATSPAGPLRVGLGSDYNDGFKLYNGLCFEACDAIASLGGATVVAPEAAPRGPLWEAASLGKRALTGTRLPRAPRQPIPGPFDLFFYVCMRPQNLLFLNSMDGWRERSGKAAAFLFETWSSQAEHSRHYLRLLDDFDHVFLFNAGSVKEVQRHTSAPCSYLPAAVDCLRATPFPHAAPRPIDVFGMGRTSEAVHGQLVEMAQARDLLYVWDHSPQPATGGFPLARFRTYNFIRHSRLFLSFNFKTGAVKIKESGGEDAVPARAFEAAAGGAVMLGTAPRVPEFDALFDWPDAHIELPMEPADVASVYAELARQPERVRRAGTLSAAQSLRRHDWVHRWEIILQTLDLPVPAAVAERKARLALLADQAEAELGPSLVRTG